MQRLPTILLATGLLATVGCDHDDPSSDDSPQTDPPSGGEADHRIFLERRVVVPPPNVARFLKAGRRHGILQLREVPESLAPVRSLGIRVHGALRNGAYLVSVPRGISALDLRRAGARALFSPRPLDRVSPRLIPLGTGPAAADVEQEVNLLFIRGTSERSIRLALAAVDADLLKLEPTAGRALIRVSLSSLVDLARFEWVTWIDAEPTLVPDLDVVTERIQADEVQPPPWGSAPAGSGLTGAGVAVGIWEFPANGATGVDDDHPDLLSRVSFGPGQNVLPSFHATHIAGVIAGDGSASEAEGGSPRQWAGVAPEAEIVSWDAGDASAEMLVSLVDFGTLITNFSYGPVIDSPAACATAGAYGVDAMGHDEVVQNAGPAAFVSPTNNGELVGLNDCDIGVWDDGVFVNLAPMDIDGGFGSVSGFGTSKNSTTVGGRIKSPPSGAAPFSGRGPTTDGRLKPDLMGISGDDDSAVTMPSTPDTYDESVGVSFAIPQGAGAAALLLEHYRQSDPTAAPSPAVFKAVLANTAADVGNENPDYSNGYGLIQVAAAVAAADSFEVRELSQGEIQEVALDLDVGDACSLRVMAVWNDPPSLGMASMELINDVDLTVVADGADVRPWVLSPGSPRNAATRGVNSRDNVEQVTVDSPSGDEFVRLAGTNILLGPQEVVVHWYAVPCPSGDTDTDTGGDDGPGGCPCSPGPEKSGGFLFMLVSVLLLRRRSQAGAASR